MPLFSVQTGRPLTQAVLTSVQVDFGLCNAAFVCANWPPAYAGGSDKCATRFYRPQLNLGSEQRNF